MDVFRREVIDNAPTIYDLSEHIENAPKIDDLSEYSDKLWKLAYERGKAEARPQGEWIPVSERLPNTKINPLTKDFEYVSCTTVWGDVRPYRFGKPIHMKEAHFWDGCMSMDKFVVAWQPLPKPFKEAENE